MNGRFRTAAESADREYGLRRRVAELLEAHRPDDPAGRLVDGFLVLLILANVAAVVLGSVDEIYARWSGWLTAFEVFSVAVFTVEYLLRLWSCVERPDPRQPGRARSRLRWALSPLGLVDLLAILPFYVFLLIPGSSESALLLRAFRAMRLVRIFKLTRYSPALNLLLAVLRKEASVLAVATSILATILLISSWGMYLLEREVQPEAFGSIPRAMWWAVISLTTVGYGDVVPATDGGRILASFTALVGVGMLALPAAILAAGFYREAHGRTETYRRAIDMALESGRITAHEAEELETLREELGINSEDAMNLLIQARHDRLGAERICPHCGEKLPAHEREQPPPLGDTP
jgi:voltage-gated potassium channel